MNVTPNVPDYRHKANQEILKTLKESGYEFEISSQKYRVSFQGKFIASAGTLKPPHGRYREANLRDNLETAVRVAMRHAAEKNA